MGCVVGRCRCGQRIVVWDLPDGRRLPLDVEHDGCLVDPRPMIRATGAAMRAEQMRAAQAPPLRAVIRIGARG